MKHKRHANITLSLSKELMAELHCWIQKRGISRFIEEAIIEKLQAKKFSIESQYIEAAQDEDRNKIFSDLGSLSEDGLSAENEW